MNTSLHKTRFRRLTCAVAAVAAAAALTACSAENEDSGPAPGSEEQTQAAAESEGGGKGTEENAAPDAPLSDLILAGDEVPGLNFEQMGNEEFNSSIATMAEEGTTIEPAECQGFANIAAGDVEGLVAAISPVDNGSSLAGVALSPNAERASTTSELVKKCPQYTAEIDNHDAIMDLAGGEGNEVPPEVEEMVRGDFGKSTQNVTMSEVEVQAPEGVEDLFAYFVEGTMSTMGQEFPTAQMQILGVVDGILVTATSGPLSGLDPVSGEQTGIPGEIDKELYQAKAEEVFAAQVEKIRSA